MTANTSVTTQHNDNYRTGAILNETVLNTSNVNGSQFGRLFERAVDGHVYAQPLYLSGVSIAGAGRVNFIYVVTMHNSVYAFDADRPEANDPLWHRSLGPSITLPDPNIGSGQDFRDILVEVGILSTPVISLKHNALYVAAAIKDGSNYLHRLFALDLATGADLCGGPRLISAAAHGTGDGSENGIIRFVSNLQNQRPGLLLSSGNVYVAFASYADKGTYHGWVIGFRADSLEPLPRAFIATPHTIAAGIWQAGQGPAADTHGNIFLLTGNGPFTERSLADKIALPVKCIGGPTALNIDDELVLLAWTDRDPKSRGRVSMAVFSNTRRFDYNFPSPGLSLDGPSLARGDGRFYLAWTAADRAQRVHVASWQHLATSDLSVSAQESSPFGPALTYAHGRLILASVVNDGSHRLRVTSSADGAQWTEEVVLEARSAAAPALAFIDGVLYLAWVSMDPSRSIYVAQSKDGICFEPPRKLAQTSPFHPALAGYNHQLEFAWTGLDRDNSLRLSRGARLDALSQEQTYDSDKAAAAPSLFTFRGNLYLLWASRKDFGRIKIARVGSDLSLGDSFVKLREDLTVADWFTPFNTYDLNAVDGDLGSGGILLLPDTNLLIGGGKEGKLYLLDRDRLGGFCSECNEDTGELRVIQSFQATAGPFDTTVPRPAQDFHHIHGSPVYWHSADRGPVIYVWGEADRLRAFAFDGEKLSPEPVDMSQSSIVTPGESMPGAMLSISANGDKRGTGIVWATHPTSADANQATIAGTLRAMDASDLSRELWNSDDEPNGRDKVGLFAKFSPPTIAAGKVYLATFSKRIVVYGLLHGSGVL